jgi:hypothetical protein
LIFEEEVKPKHEAELKQKIQQFKSKGLKKIEVQGKLGITKTVLDKFWY